MSLTSKIPFSIMVPKKIRLKSLRLILSSFPPKNKRQVIKYEMCQGFRKYFKNFIYKEVNFSWLFLVPFCITRSLSVKVETKLTWTFKRQRMMQTTNSVAILNFTYTISERHNCKLKSLCTLWGTIISSIYRYEDFPRHKLLALLKFLTQAHFGESHWSEIIQLILN